MTRAKQLVPPLMAEAQELPDFVAYTDGSWLRISCAKSFS